jgi:PPK2 family polyphosphate:nucleotide phosphotransferase
MSARFVSIDSPFLVPFDGSFHIHEWDTAPSKKKRDDAANDAALEAAIERMQKLQARLLANDRKALLVVFQAMDAAGKDGAIKHVLSGVNPQGCEVSSFKAPTSEDLDHDYLWRCMKRLPERGRIGIFNRSYYEETLVVRVHPELLAKQKLPEECVTKNIWEERFEDIRNFEKYLVRNGTIIRKFFLHVSKDEQKKRFLERIDNPDKNWKFSAADVRERGYWKDVVPADNKWFTRVVVAAAVIEALDSLRLDYPKLSEAHRKDLAAVKAELLKGK